MIDEAFEYLSVEVGKGKKGQYFTPRHDIDMCVKMLNPDWNEYVVDTAAGSCGFTVHTIFHVWGNEFTANGPTREQADYANSMVYAIDFDPRSIKIAKALNLIAGDGRTNVYRANTLDPRGWPDEVKVGLRPRLARFPRDPEKDRWNRENLRYFGFDVLLTNPPFAGDIKDSRILHQYELAKKPKGGKWQTKVGRDILFIQRNLDFLRPGGRMAIVLPQGRFNNTSDKPIRDFIAQHAAFSPWSGFTGTPSSPTPAQRPASFSCRSGTKTRTPGRSARAVEDYPIFFATSQAGGKDTSGEYVYLSDDKGRRLYDLHAHPMVDHDLFNLRAALADQRDQRLSAAKDGQGTRRSATPTKRRFPLSPTAQESPTPSANGAGSKASPSATRMPNNGRVEHSSISRH